MNYLACQGTTNLTAWNTAVKAENIEGYAIHTCFDICKPADATGRDKLFEIDERPVCDAGGEVVHSGIICVHPEFNDCDVLRVDTQICFDLGNEVCIDWALIFLCIFLSNLLQVMFQAALTKSCELTYYPTELDLMQDPELNNQKQQDANNPDSKSEPKCDVVLKKCFGELFAICIYVLMLCFLIVGLQQ